MEKEEVRKYCGQAIKLLLQARKHHNRTGNVWRQMLRRELKASVKIIQALLALTDDI